ncbi:DUF1214 domain-containing protein [Nocardia tengchongensis]|uniref:DUF1214 domain-containing protein n=1 Tax=Nocardia tengchongensis TaxID=2055889 RepID=UPI0036C25ED6
MTERVESVRSGALFEEVGQAWQRFGRTIVFDDPATDTPLLRAEGLRFATRYLAAGALLSMELADPMYPEFGRWADTTCSWGIDNPDLIYTLAAVSGDRTYRISGDRGTAHYFDIQVHSPHFCEAPDYRINSNIDSRSLVADADGSFELLLGPERPNGYTGNWLTIDAAAESLCVRQVFSDWVAERPANLVIECVDAVYPPPTALSEADVAARAERLVRWLDKAGTFWDQQCKLSLNAPANSLAFTPLSESAWGGFQNQAYGMGSFHCAPDEAVILEFTPPNCHYWSFGLGNWYWETVNWFSRQSSLNHLQARLDDDGVFRAVIAHRDPGVPNWLDTGGHTHGTVNGRLLLTDGVPSPTMRLVPFEDVRKYLPEATPTVTVAERTEQIRARRRSAHLRNSH